MLMEQFLDGPEVDVDATWQQWGISTKGNLRDIWGEFGEHVWNLVHWQIWDTSIGNSTIPASETIGISADLESIKV